MKIGLIIPSSNTTMEVEFWTMASGRAAVHAARIRLRNITLEELKKQNEQIKEASIKLADAAVDVIGYGCTSGSLYKGLKHGKEIEREITQQTGIPSVSTSNAVFDALKSLRIKKVCIATPYTEEINQLEKRFLEQNKIKVLKIQGLGLVANTEVGDRKPNAAYKLAKGVDTPEAGGIFISCTNFRTIEVIERLEKELKKPVVSSNTATYWALMKKIHREIKQEEYGKLFH